MTSIYFDNNCSVEINNNSVFVRGRIFLSNLASLEPVFLDLKKYSISQIDFTSVEEFDTAIVILLCRVRRFMLESDLSDVVWKFPEELGSLLKLYGVEGCFKSK